jgi:hypothetical protein
LHPVAYSGESVKVDTVHPVVSDVQARQRRGERHAEAASARLLASAAPLPRVSLPERLVARRQAIGYRLVEAGLRLIVGRLPAAGTVRPRVRS